MTDTAAKSGTNWGKSEAQPMTDRKINVEMSEEQHTRFLNSERSSIEDEIRDALGYANHEKALQLTRIAVEKFAELLALGDNPTQPAEAQMRKSDWDTKPETKSNPYERVFGIKPEPQPETLPNYMFADKPAIEILSKDEVVLESDLICNSRRPYPHEIGEFAGNVYQYVTRKKPEPRAEPAPKSTKPEDNIPEGYRKVLDGFTFRGDLLWVRATDDTGYFQECLPELFGRNICTFTFVIRRKESAK